MKSVIVLLALLAIGFAKQQAKSGACPFEVSANAHEITHPLNTVPYCNVSLIGDNLCACYKNNHCHSGCGCLVPAGTCNSGACAFPRVCLCENIGSDDSQGSSCSPVDSGPCIDCSQTSEAPPKHVPASFIRLLRHEFSLMPESDLDMRLSKLGLEKADNIHAKVQDLVTYVAHQHEKTLVEHAKPHHKN